MLGKGSDPFMDRYWPLLLMACCGLVLLYTLSGMRVAGAVGFLGLGWLAWDRLIKPKMGND
ncbi:MAG: hypothetical protein AAF409_01755 [Pseudomonadota bacterium]